MRSKSSILWKLPNEEFEGLVKQETSVSAILRKFGLGSTGNNFQIVNIRIEQLNLNTSHFIKNKPSEAKPIETYLVSGRSTTNNNSLKRRLIKMKLLEELCQKCGQNEIWQGNRLVLQLDHINGVKTDNRLANLRLLCPNCHTQTSTYAGKNLSRVKAKKI